MKFNFSTISKLRLLKISLVLICIVLLSGCLSIKRGSSKSGKNLFETFYVGEDGTQYFIKPLSFFTPINKDKIDIDFTFRYKNEVKDSVTVNLSLVGSDLIKNIDSLSFSNSAHQIISTHIELLFNERTDKLFTSRFSTKISLQDLNKLFEKDNWEITTLKTGTTYTTGKKTQKAIGGLRNAIFILF